MTQPIRKLKIPRDKWLRGEDSHRSYLLRSEDEKMCCLGIYLKELGVPEEKLRDIQDPRCEILDEYDEAQWLILHPPDVYFNRPSSLACKMMNINDQVVVSDDIDNKFTEQERESQIAACFLEVGVEITFE